MIPCYPPDANELYLGGVERTAIICEASTLKAAEDKKRELGLPESCKIYKEQGEEIYRLICEGRRVLVRTGYGDE